MALDFSIADSAFTSVSNALQTYAMVFASGDGLALTRWIIFIAIVYNTLFILLAALAGSGKDAMQKGISMLVYAAIVGGLIGSWDTIMVPMPLATADAFVKIVTFGDTAQGLGQQMSLHFSNALGSILETVSPSQQPLPQPDGTTKSLWDSVVALVDGSALGVMIMSALDGLVGSAFAILAVLALGVAFAEAWFALLAADILITIALAFGPLMLAASVSDQFRQLKNKFIAFLVGAVMLKPIIAILLSVSMLVLKQLENIAQTNPTSSTPQALILFFVLVFIMAMHRLISMAPDISRALFDGLGGAVTDTVSRLQEGAGKIKEIATSKPKPSSPPPGNNPPPPPPRMK